MSAIVIDTNVLLVADGQAEQMSNDCQAECRTRLERIQEAEQVVLDDGWLILGEYQKKLNPNSQPTWGRLFVKWLLQRQAMPRYVSHVTITALDDEQTRFVEFPSDVDLETAFDPSDRKFVAVACAHKEKPPILEAADSKWLDWEQRLARHGVRLEFLCHAELNAIRRRKKA